MTPISRVVPLVLSALLAVVLAGCAAPQRSDAHAHQDTGAMDMQATCEMQKKMMSGKPPAEQQAMMQENMKSMTPEMRQRAQAMHEKCK
ncbi:hypothetical protein [Polaromonas sp. LjRoot131]|jgi:hypothetical protein|uniref:hypothetical protein n=1 Tax=Polaromonas sp. LjRoot131 TaxID=3342262 RepID=UPI003ED007FD